LGIEPAQAKRWFNDKMRQARYLFTQHVRGVEQLIYEHEDVRYVVDSRNNVIVTVKPAVDTSILTPVFEREHRRIKREVTRHNRSNEEGIVKLTIKVGERQRGKASSNNPKTRDLIKRDIDALQAKLNVHEATITREQERLKIFEKATE